MNRLRLLAREPSDLEIIAGAVQDAIFQIGQTRYDVAGRSFTLRLSRYMHESNTAHRIESGLRFDGVMNVRAQGVDLDKRDAFAVILGLTFEDMDRPAGLLTLTLSGGGIVQIYIEAIDVTLADKGEPRATKHIPSHDD